MTTNTRRIENLKRLLSPRHIAFIGGRGMHYAIGCTEQIGYPGQIWVVNPQHDEIAGHRCYATLDHLPEAPDAVFLAVRADLTVPMVRDLADRGAGGCVAYAAGFAEIGGPGVALQAALKDAAGDLALIGPNCYGVLNYVDGAALWASPIAGKRVERGVAIISQSGNISINLTYTGRSVPLAYVISVGNQAVMGPADLIPALVDDPAVNAIGLYIEGLDDVPKFSAAAAYALAKGVPIVAIKVGRSEIASRIAVSHTSSLAGSDQFYDALFERLGIIRVNALSTFLETLKLLSLSGPMSGRSLGVLTCSGGEAALVADLAQDLGLSIPELPAEQATAIAGQLPAFATVANPLDYNTAIWGQPEALRDCFAPFMEAGFDATALVLDFPRADVRGFDEYDAAADALIAAQAQTGARAMLVASLAEMLPEAVRERLIAAGLVPLQGLEDAMIALSGAAWYHEVRQARAAEAAADALRLPDVPDMPLTARVLSEADSKARLADYGLVVPEGRVVGADAAGATAAAIGFPVAVKATAAALAHKTELGAVALNLRDEAAVTAAVTEIDAAMAKACHGGAEQFLVEAMVTDAVAELIVGITRDPQFGLVLLLGSGGVLVDLLADSQVLLLPTDRAAIERALGRLRINAFLDGFRGQTPGDRAAVIDAVLAVVRFAEDHRDSLIELDVNPLLVRPEGHGAIAADALIRLADDA